MPDTHGFEVVAEVTVGVLRDFLDAAWENGGTSDPGSIPHEVAIPPGLTFPGTTWAIDHGQVAIPREGLNLDMAPADNGITVTLGVNIQVAMDPETIPLPSLSLFDMGADISITAPFGVIPDTDNNIGVIFDGLPRNKVAVNITTGDPIGPITLELIDEYIHNEYETEGGAIPHTYSKEGVSLGVYSSDVYVEMYDDPEGTGNRIQVSDAGANQIKISIPVYLRLSNMAVSFLPESLQPLSPMGVRARIAITAPLESDTGTITAKLSAATVTVEKADGLSCAGGDYCSNGNPCLTPADGDEGTNYTLNKNGACLLPAPLGPIDMETLLIAQIIERGQALLLDLGDIPVEVPTVADIEDFIGNQVHAEIVSRRYMGVWTPETPEGSPVEIDEVRPKALADALAIAINPKSGAANENALTNLIPAGSPFAIALDADFVEQTIGEIVNKPKDEGGFGGVPQTFDNIDGYKARLLNMHWDLRDGAIHFWGDVKVYDVFCGADATASFWADIGLRWSAPDAEGKQTLEPYLIDKDVDLPWWAWLLVVVGFIIGLIVGIIVLVITIVIENIAERIGGGVMEDEVSGQLQTLGAWPQQLQGVGEVTSIFDTHVGIDSHGLLFYGQISVTSTYSSALISAAGVGGPYTGFAASVMHFNAGFPNPNMSYHWDFGDGNSADGHAVTHIYADDGLYVLRLTMVVNEPGGATTHESTLVYVKNVAPGVDAGADRTIDEGEMVDYVGQFTDPEIPDTHEAVWNFGDDALPTPGTVTQGQPSGTVSGQHAYGDNGVYTVRLTVRDDDGGVGYDEVRMTVLNVPPTVDAGPDRYAYTNFPIRLIANFTDPGWLDTHFGIWEFGDCTPPGMAVIAETHEPPQGKGKADITHIYRHCGIYQAKATVVDDDGGVGSDTVLIHVVELENADFEKGFRSLNLGVVANGWKPYSLAIKDPLGQIVAPAAPSPFSADEYIESNGRRAQKVAYAGPLHAGLYQHIGANPGWEYEFQARYHMAEAAPGEVRLGIDPKGGVDPESEDIVWASGYQTREWSSITGRAEADNERITVFLEVRSLMGEKQRQSAVWFDEVRLYPHQLLCPGVEGCVPVCIDFNEFEPGTAREAPIVHHQVGFVPLDKSVYFDDFGEPQGEVKLIFSRKGVRADFPGPVDKVLISVMNYEGRQIRFRVFSGITVVQQFVEIIYNEVRELSIEQSCMTALEVSGGNGKAGIVKLCLCLPETPVEPEPPCEEGCVDFEEMKGVEVIQTAFVHHTMTFTPLGEYGCRPVSWGKPEGRTKLVFPAEGLRIELALAVDSLKITFNNYHGEGLDFYVYTGDELAQSFFEELHNDVKTITISQPGMTSLVIKGGGNEAAVVELCLCLPPARASGKISRKPALVRNRLMLKG